MPAWVLADSGSERRPRGWVQDRAYDGQSSLLPVQLLSVPICTSSFHSDPMALAPSCPQGQANRHVYELWSQPSRLPAPCETAEFRS